MRAGAAARHWRCSVKALGRHRPLCFPQVPLRTAARRPILLSSPRMLLRYGRSARAIRPWIPWRSWAGIMRRRPQRPGATSDNRLHAHMRQRCFGRFRQRRSARTDLFRELHFLCIRMARRVRALIARGSRVVCVTTRVRLFLASHTPLLPSLSAAESLHTQRQLLKRSLQCEDALLYRFVRKSDLHVRELAREAWGDVALRVTRDLLRTR
mmetsp:Transcript_102974/g.297772  ORF Transcript_102974/g.297772 Transcript_102974/m.297772 type:complete len:211 (-) Transcript_102974:2068-2700(-)